MAQNKLIDVVCFGIEIGKLGIDENENKSYFQYNPDFLNDNTFRSIFPETGIIRKTAQTQVFRQFNNETFRGLPPQIADSLPDLFGNIIFKTWLENSNNNFAKITALEQLAYVANRGMGALEYKPSIDVKSDASININEITEVLKNVLNLKNQTSDKQLNTSGLLNIFRIGTSAGGARPKILVSENKGTGEIVPGDIILSKDYNHYLVKLNLDDEPAYDREVVEYCYYRTATNIGIRMMPSKLIDNKHFATLRFDRIDGKKKHILTATGLTGWSFMDPEVSTYENLFDLALFLKIPHKEIEELFKRMVFNVVFCNTDDHLKNHTFIYNELTDGWNLSPAYDLTYSLNPLINYKRTSRALSINGKRIDISLHDVQLIANKYTVKNARSIVQQITAATEVWERFMLDAELPKTVIENIKSDFNYLN